VTLTIDSSLSSRLALAVKCQPRSVQSPSPASFPFLVPHSGFHSPVSSHLNFYQRAATLVHVPSAGVGRGEERFLRDGDRSRRWRRRRRRRRGRSEAWTVNQLSGVNRDRGDGGRYADRRRDKGRQGTGEGEGAWRGSSFRLEADETAARRASYPRRASL